MGFLDNSSITVDAILTKRGREILAAGGDLNITKLTEFSIVDGLKGDYIHPHVDASAMQEDNADLTSIFYFSKNWKKEYGGATCILSDASYDNIVYEPEDLDNSYLAFMQKENSWHGYKRIMVNNHRRAVLVTHG